MSEQCLLSWQPEMHEDNRPNRRMNPQDVFTNDLHISRPFLRHTLLMQRETLDAYEVPDTPGIYRFQKGKRILYIGKATSLRDRVRSYFARALSESRSVAIVSMVEEADTLTWESTDSVLEALILEANLIKKHEPPYNTASKDNKSFNPKIAITINAQVSRNLYFSISLTNHCAMKRMVSIPINTPVQTKIIFGENATAAKTLSMENAISINSTKHTVAQKLPIQPTVNL